MVSNKHTTIEEKEVTTATAVVILMTPEEPVQLPQCDGNDNISINRMTKCQFKKVLTVFHT